ncbi:MAG: hypothetical protein JWP50_344, partial [Phenylobacterium sp.]|nr:hypothetical protein [Phenylobacterium sp.]
SSPRSVRAPSKGRAEDGGGRATDEGPRRYDPPRPQTVPVLIAHQCAAPCSFSPGDAGERRQPAPPFHLGNAERPQPLGLPRIEGDIWLQKRGASAMRDGPGMSINSALNPQCADGVGARPCQVRDVGGFFFDIDGMPKHLKCLGHFVAGRAVPFRGRQAGPCSASRSRSTAKSRSNRVCRAYRLDSGRSAHGAARAQTTPLRIARFRAPPGRRGQSG